MVVLWLIMGLSDKQRRFVVEYVIDSNGTQAAIRAGYAPNSAHDSAFNLLSNPEVAELINDRIREIASSKALTVEWVLDQWRQVAIADPTEAVYIRIECCRHCWGINFAYQWTEFEYSEAVKAAASHVCKKSCDEQCGKKFPPMALGGFQFDPKTAPNPECPMCHGDGVERVVVVDSKSLRGPVRRLIAGIKQTQHGIEVKFRDQDKARDNIAKYLGMLIEKREMSGPGGGPIPIANFDAKDLTDDQLAQIATQE